MAQTPIQPEIEFLNPIASRMMTLNMEFIRVMGSDKKLRALHLEYMRTTHLLLQRLVAIDKNNEGTISYPSVYEPSKFQLFLEENQIKKE